MASRSGRPRITARIDTIHTPAPQPPRSTLTSSICIWASMRNRIRGDHPIEPRGDGHDRHRGRRARHRGGRYGHAHLQAPGTERPWRPRFDVKTSHEERMLQAACLRGLRLPHRHARLRGPVDALRLFRRSPGARTASLRGIGSAPSAIRTSPPWRAGRLDHHRSRHPSGSGAGTALRSCSRCPWRRHVVASAVAEDGHEDHVSAEIVRQLNVYRDHLNALFGTERDPSFRRPPQRAMAYHHSPVPAHDRLAYCEPTVRYDRRHDSVQARLGRRVRRVRRLQPLRLPRRGRGGAPPRPARRSAHLFR